MPWCEPCGRFYNPNTLTPEGRCPADHAVGEPQAGAGDRPGPADEPGHGPGAAGRRPEPGAAGPRPGDRGSEAEASAVTGGQVDVADEEDPTKVPWHFWLLVIALVLYLGWRLVQGIEWLFR